MQLVEMVLFRQSHKVPGAALQIPCSERTALRWHGDFIREIAAHFTCDSLR